MRLHSHKVTISLSEPLYDFLGNYQEEHHCKSRSEVISMALHLLQQEYLKACYKEASQEMEETDKDFDILSSEGIEDDEAW